MTFAKLGEPPPAQNVTVPNGLSENHAEPRTLGGGAVAYRMHSSSSPTPPVPAAPPHHYPPSSAPSAARCRNPPPGSARAFKGRRWVFLRRRASRRNSPTSART